MSRIRSDTSCKAFGIEKQKQLIIPEGFCVASDTGKWYICAFGQMDRGKQTPDINKTSPSKRKLAGMGWFIAICVPAFYAAPVIALLLIIYLGTANSLFLMLTLLSFLLYVLVVAYFVKKLKEPLDPTEKYGGPVNDTDPETTAKTAGLILGAGLLGHYIGKHRKFHSERVSDDWLWQEKYRHHGDY